MSAQRRAYAEPPLNGPVPTLYGRLVTGRHGDVLHGLWHTRQVNAWRAAWHSHLIEQVQWHGDNLWTVPSQTVEDKWYVVRRWPLAPDGYLYVCDCPASDLGGWVCAHGMAVYLWRLRHALHWRLKPPEKGA